VDFYEILPVLGRFLRFKKPVNIRILRGLTTKPNRGLRKAVLQLYIRFCTFAAFLHIVYINQYLIRLQFRKEHSATITQIGKKAVPP
jgi:hypothetical protein